MEEIRETRGLSYSVSSNLIPMQATGPFMISMQIRADQVDQALEVIHQSLDRFISEGPTEAELVRTRRQISGEFPLSTANNAAIVGQLGVIGFYGLPLNHLQLFLDQVQALTTEDIRQAFARHFDPERRLVVTVGPAALAVPQPEEQLDEEVQSEEDALSVPATPAEPTPGSPASLVPASCASSPASGAAAVSPSSSSRACGRPRTGSVRPCSTG